MLHGVLWHEAGSRGRSASAWVVWRGVAARCEWASPARCELILSVACVMRGIFHVHVAGAERDTVMCELLKIIGNNLSNIHLISYLRLIMGENLGDRDQRGTQLEFTVSYLL